ncbi:MAG: Verru_Chthon cassette protein B [Verrucomicrobiales bacterium]|nr:Verru_Chthon cassette protein B [Verrucomicrobiales bacterium]
MKPLSHHAQKGFSLLEVIVAMGIVATVMIALVGVMPSGVASIQEASVTSIEARIMQEIISDAQSAEWLNKGADPFITTIDELDDDTRYYDRYGTLLDKSGGNSNLSQRPAYAAKLEIVDRRPIVQNREREELKQKSNIWKLKVSVEYTPGGKSPTFNKKDPKRRITEQSFYVTFMGRKKDLAEMKN